MMRIEQTAQSEYRSYRAVHPFDVRFGVETGGLIYDLPSGLERDASNNGYFAVAPSVFHECLNRLPLDHPRFTFIDAGSGKGRALLLASGYPFREVIGVEISPQLHRIARENIRRYARSKTHAPVTAVQADAAEFSFPSGPLLVYMWNAFTEPVMERVLKNLRASLLQEPREIYVIYIHPELEAMLEALPWIERLWSSEIALSEEDYAAWAFPERIEVCSAYKLLVSNAV